MTEIKERAYSYDNEEWQAPIVGLSEAEREALAGRVQVVDGLDAFVDERIERLFGRVEQTDTALEEARTKARVEIEDASNWVHVPWLHTVIRYPAKEEHRDIRTWRNKNLITPEEQQKLLEARIAVIGLSVGSNIVDQLSQSGIGDAFLMADRDRISPSNLNRIRASMADIGLKKTVVAGRKLSLVDPYIEQLHLPEGYVEDETDIILEQWRPDIIFDEVDDLAVKAMIRRVAKELRIPVVMVGDIHERSVIDVERYDISSDVQPFNGKISEADYQRLLHREVAPEEVIGLLVQLNGIENISERLFASAGDPSLGGLPQLGSTAARGGTHAEKISRAIILDQGLESGTYVDNPDAFLRLE